jgi:hypothetical protein
LVVPIFLTVSMSHGRQPRLSQECGPTEPAASRWLNALVNHDVHHSRQNETEKSSVPWPSGATPFARGFSS